MAAMSVTKIVSSSPIIVIIGATGTGKSKLAVEIAKRFNGEVISADSMQVYKGLDIITNKVTAEEQGRIPHHLLNFVNPLTGITVVEFRNKALKIIEELLNRKKLPVIVGGTLYYIESILYDILIPEPEKEDGSESPAWPFRYDAVTPGGSSSTRCRDDPNSDKKSRRSGSLPRDKVADTENITNEELYKRIQEVDPEMTEVLHPGDRRKLLRCLEVYEQTGQKLSALLEKQRSKPGGTILGGPPRFPNCAILWLKCDEAVLNERLDNRVDKMLASGLLSELLEFHVSYNRSRLKTNELPDYTKGIFQAIGFKEFHEYLTLSEEERESEAGRKLFEKGVESLKLVTRRYAKRQLKWITNRFLKSGRRQMPPIYALDATDPANWEKKVYAVAEDVVDSLLAGRSPCHDPAPLTEDEGNRRKIFKCNVCEKYFGGRKQFEAHLKGSRHRKALNGKKRAEEKARDGAEEESAMKVT